MDKGIFFLIKFGESEYMEKLHHEGEMLLQQLKMFRKPIYNTQRRDIYEGFTHIVQRCIPSITIHNKAINNHYTPIIFDTRNDNPYIYCMCAINHTYLSHNNKSFIDSTCFELGDTAVIIKNTFLFLDKVQNYCIKNNYQIDSGHIKYIDFNKHNGKLNLFTKSKDYEHQSEYRLTINTHHTHSTSLKIKLGNLSREGHSIICKSYEIEKHLKQFFSYTTH
ncbi:hypothetical protein [Zooshikella harenae]|uniref:Uncharacterized protein n=1 Tax=Zooshikella harenae TaxID=2827238 RepID=A0ABS5ZH92_9GAMM|nr:hypothetical protein [Zooshikella harenae]MBU2713426.1 hypothetical protein [Zooshikella harenae]